MEFKGTKNDLWQVSEFEDILEVVSGNYPLICSFPVNDDEGKANAKLISQAPEMLEQLKECLEFLQKVQSPATQALFLSQSIKNLIKEATTI